MWLAAALYVPISMIFFFVGSGLFAFYRAGLLTFFFVARRGRAGLVQVDLPPLAGHLVDLDVAFDRAQALVTFVLDHGGRVLHRVAALAADGSVSALIEVGRRLWP